MTNYSTSHLSLYNELDELRSKVKDEPKEEPKKEKKLGVFGNIFLYGVPAIAAAALAYRFTTPVDENTKHIDPSYTELSTLGDSKATIEDEGDDLLVPDADDDEL